MLKIKNKIEFENNLWVGLVDCSKANSSQEERIKFVTDVASITMGRLGLWGMAAWQQDPNSWDNLFNLRIDPKAQSITQQVVENIKKLM